MSSYTVRGWVTIGLFAALWGVVELTLGSVLHAIFPSQANTFLTGVLMGGIGVAVALTGRHFVPNRGSVLLISIVTALLKLLSPGGIKIGPVVAILVEGALMEAALWIARTPQMLGLDVSAAILILAILLLVRLVVGGIGGWCAWELGGAVARRLGRRGPATSEVAH